MDDYTELFETFVENFNEITENKTKKTHIKLSTIKHLLDETKKKCVIICNDKLETLTKTKTLNPIQSFVKTQFKQITKEDKEQYNFNGLQGYKKFEKNIKYLINEDEIDINDNDFDINEILEDLSELIIDNKEDKEDKEKSTKKSAKQTKSVKSTKSSKKNVKIDSDTEDDNDNQTDSEEEHINCKTEHFSDNNSDDDEIEEDIPPPPKNITKTEKVKKKKKKNKD